MDARGRFALLTGTWLVGALLVAPASRAATIEVTTTQDPGNTPGAVSLREAVAQAADGDRIDIPAGTYTLNGAVGPLVVAKSVNFVGAGPTDTTITASPSSLLLASTSTVSVSGITFTGGTGTGEGGAIDNTGTMSIADCDFTGNTSGAGSSGGGGSGGAIYSWGSLTVTHSTFSGNVAAGGTGAPESLSYSANGGGSGGAIAFDGEPLAPLTISSSTFTGNEALGGADDLAAGTAGSDGGIGGAIAIPGAYGAGDSGASIADSMFGGNTALAGGSGSGGVQPGGGGFGGAIGVGGSADITASTFTNNSVVSSVGGDEGFSEGIGGAIGVNGFASVDTSTINANTAPGGGGGGVGVIAQGAASITNSTLVSNTAADGGALLADSLYAKILNNDTIVANTASSRGGGVGLAGGYTRLYGGTELANVTLVANTAPPGGGGNIDPDYSVYLQDTLIAGSSSPSQGGNCTGAINSLGNNAEDADQCGLNGPGDLVSAVLPLSALGNYGGPTQTIALLPGNPAVDAGHPGGCPSAWAPWVSQYTNNTPLLLSDQRGVARPQGQQCDIGAFERQATGDPTGPPWPWGATGTTGSAGTTASSGTTGGPTNGSGGVAGTTSSSTSTPRTAPRDSALTMQPSTFARGHGTILRYSDSAAATTTFTLMSLTTGFRTGRTGPCRARAARILHGAHTCPRLLVVGSFAHADAPGRNALHFNGRLAGFPLAPGRYELAAVPNLSGLSGTGPTVVFRVR